VNDTENIQKERTAYFDNAKLFLIFLVVFGHLLEYLLKNRILLAIYDFIYLFHIPAFVLIAGFFSKNTSTIWKKILKYSVFYFVFSFYYLLSFQTATPFLINPYWVMWYLLSLISWNLLLKLFKHIKFAIPIAFLIGIAAGYINGIGNILALSRTLVFFPFFLIGYYLNTDLFKIINIKTKIIAFLILTAIFYLVYFYQISPEWLYGSLSYFKLGVSEWYAGTVRLYLYILSALSCLCVLILIPEKRFKITKMGENTIYVYLLHGIFVILVSSLVVFQKFSVLTQLIISICVSVLLIIILSSKPIKKTIDYIIEFLMDILIRCKSKH